MPFETEQARSDYYAANQQYWQAPEGSAPTAPPATRYTGTDTAEKPDAVTDYFTKLKDQTAMPDEARRAALRSQAQQEVQTQLSAIDQMYATLITDERMRQGKQAQLGAAQVSGIGRLSGLGGSSVQAARQSQQSEAAAEAERAATQLLAAKQGAERAAIIGKGQADAEARYNQEVANAQAAQGKYSDYMLKLAESSPEAASPMEVGGYLIDPTTGKVIFAPPEKTAEGKTYTLSPGQRVYDATGKVIAESPAGAADGKMLTLSPGEIAYNADGSVFARGGEKTLNKDLPTLAQEYEYAKTQGYNGSYIDYLKAKDTGGVNLSIGGGYTPGASPEIDAWVSNIQTGRAQLNDVPKEIKGAVAIGLNTNQTDPRVGELNATLGLLDEIIASPYLSQVTGAINPFTYWTPGTNEQYVKSQVTQLKSFLALENRQKMKGQGTISDREFKVLTDAATALNGNLSDKDTLTELQKLRSALGGRLGELMKSAPVSSPVGTQREQMEVDGVIYEDDGSGNFVPKAQGGSPTAKTTEVRRVAEAIGQFESGGNYKALGPTVTSGMYKGDRAYGKYQVMGKNIPSWSLAALGRKLTPEQFLADPKAQDAVADYYMGKHLAKYGNVRDVASVWFSGRPVARAGNAKDVLGTSVPKYVKNVEAIYNRI